MILENPVREAGQTACTWLSSRQPWCKEWGPIRQFLFYWDVDLLVTPLWEFPAWRDCPELLWARLLSVPNWSTVKREKKNACCLPFLGQYARKHIYWWSHFKKQNKNLSWLKNLEASSQLKSCWLWTCECFSLCLYSIITVIKNMFFPGETLIRSNQRGFLGTDTLWNCRFGEKRLAQLRRHTPSYWKWQSWAKLNSLFLFQSFILSGLCVYFKEFCNQISYFY